MKTLSGSPGELNGFMEYWICPVHGQVKRGDFEVKNKFGKYYAFHKAYGCKLKALSYTKSNIGNDKGLLALLKPNFKRGAKRSSDGWMEPDNLDEVLRQ